MKTWCFKVTGVLSIDIILVIINLNYKTSAMQPIAHLATSKVNNRPKTWDFYFEHDNCIR